MNQNAKPIFISISPERILLLIANFTLVGDYPTLTIFHLSSSLSSPAASTNQRAALVRSSISQHRLVSTSPSLIDTTTLLSYLIL